MQSPKIILVERQKYGKTHVVGAMYCIDLDIIAQMYGKTHYIGAILDSPPIGRISDLTLDPHPLERQKYGKTHVVGAMYCIGPY